MSDEQKVIIDQALRLPPELRAALAAQLLDSLDDKIDPDAERLWSEEIARRLKEIDSGVVETVPWSEARKEIFRSDEAACEG